MIARRWLAGLIGAALVATLATPVGANTIVRVDADDARTPLDLRSVRVSHGPSHQTFRLRTYSAFTDAQIDARVGWFRLGFDSGSGSFDRSVYVVRADGKLQGILTDRRGGFLRTVPAWRLAADAVGVRVPDQATGSTSNYRFAAWSVWRGAPCSKAEPCVDWLPDTSTILHDLAAPVIRWGRLPDPSTRTSSTASVTIAFAVRDRGPYPSGVDRWTLFARPAGVSGWARVGSGSSGGSLRVPFHGHQGMSFVFRVVAADRQGNARASTRGLVTFPVDDAGRRAAYGPSEVSWIGEQGVRHAYLGTRHVSAVAGAEVTFTFRTAGAVDVCVLGGPSSAPVAADVALDGGTTADAVNERPTTRPRASIGCLATAGGGRHRLTLTADDEGLVVDGLLVG